MTQDAFIEHLVQVQAEGVPTYFDTSIFKVSFRNWAIGAALSKLWTCEILKHISREKITFRMKWTLWDVPEVVLVVR
jgi:hypothetical protein